MSSPTSSLGIFPGFGENPFYEVVSADASGKGVEVSG